MRRMLADLKYALGQLKRSPGFAGIAVLILALGIGATTAIYTLIDQALLRSLPVRDPARLVELNGSGGWEGYTDSYGGDASNYFSWPMYRDLRDRNTVFSGVLAVAEARAGIVWHDQSELKDVQLLSGNAFNVLGERPALGRLLEPADDRATDGSPVVVLSYAHWQREFGGDPGVLNKTLSVNGQPFTIVGVAAPGFHGVRAGQAPALFVPMMMKPEVVPGQNDLENRQGRWLNILARLKPGVSRGQAQAAMQPLWHALRAQELTKIADHSARFRESFLDHSALTLHDGARGFTYDTGVRMPLLIVSGMALMVLLMACANIAGLMLVRAAGRVREISVRYALGARRGQILRQLLTEGLLLGLSGGALGLWLAPRLASLLERRILDQAAGELPYATHPDARMLALALLLTVGVSLLFSLAPAIQFWRPDLGPALNQSRPTLSAGPLRLQRFAVGVQIGLSALLLMSAGLFVRTLYNLKSVNVGFRTDHLVQFRIDPRLAGYASDRVPALYRRTLDTLRALPGIRAVGATTDPVFAGIGSGFNITVAGYKAADGEDTGVENGYVTPGFFSSLGAPLLAGRTIRDSDTANSAKVSVVNEAFARHYFGDPRNAIGKFWGIGGGTSAKTDIQIVGVVQDFKHGQVNEKRIGVATFLPSQQQETPEAMTFYLRTSQPPEAALAMVRRSMRTIDPKLVLTSLETMHGQVDELLDTQRTVALLAISFGLLALGISAIGLYALLAYATAQRTREIGLRMALGATRASVAGMVLWDMLRLAVLSLAVALPAAWLLTQWVRSQLYGVSGHDPLTLVAVTLSVLLIAALAAALPAWRAAVLEPMVALRHE